MKVVGENALKKLITLIKTKFESLAKVATSGSYNDLSNKPTIPSVGNGKITIKQGETTKGTFTVNQTGATTIELTDNDTHYASGTVVTNDATKTGNYGAALTNGNVHLNHVENGAVKNSHKITGSGATTVTSDASGNIIITSTDNNTTYGVATTSANGLMSSTDKSKLDNLQVGGRNLYTQNTTLSNLSTYSTIKRDTDINGFIVTCNSDGDAHPRIKNIIEGKTWYTVSAYIKADTSCTMAWDVCDYSLGSINITTEYQYFKGTVYNSRNDSPVYNFVDIEVNAQGANNKLYFKNFKVEKGTMATDWTPAPEDADSLYSSIDHTHTKSQITDFPTSLKNPNALTLRYNGNLATEVVYDGSGTNTFDVTPGMIGAAKKDHTHTKSQITDFPTSLKNPNGLRVQVNGDGASEVRYDGSVAKTINIKAGSNITITSDSSGNITISSTASAGSVTGDVGTVVYEATAYNTGLRCDGSTTNNTNNSVTIQDGNWNYKRFRFYCKGYFGLVCTDMPLDRQCDSYITDNERGKRYGGVIFPTAENGNINNTGIGPSNHMYYEIKWRVERVAVGWTVRVVDSGWFGFNAGITSNADYTNNAGTSNAGTGYISWNQRHNYSYGIYKIVAYTD